MLLIKLFYDQKIVSSGMSISLREFIASTSFYSLPEQDISTLCVAPACKFILLWFFKTLRISTPFLLYKYSLCIYLLVIPFFFGEFFEMSSEDYSGETIVLLCQPGRNSFNIWASLVSLFTLTDWLWRFTKTNIWWKIELMKMRK